MVALPAEHDDPLDPQRIIGDLPAAERVFFLAEYRAAVGQAQDPAAWPELARLLRLWRAHADMAAEPCYREALAQAHGPVQGMLLEDVARMREAGTLDAYVRAHYA